ncbi:MAG: hypothetical protein OEV40_29760 [Acidimicrobiia bacterium]|nr:hypothetical protein [Acidimicrobiia bacterium]
MTYTPATGYALMAVAVLCFVLGAPPWMFLATGLAAVVFGYLGLRQGRARAAEAANGEGDGQDRGGDV